MNYNPYEPPKAPIERPKMWIVPGDKRTDHLYFWMLRNYHPTGLEQLFWLVEILVPMAVGAALMWFYLRHIAH